jgi:hypothetical protein
MKRILSAFVVLVTMAAGAASAHADEVTDWTRMMLQAALVVANSPTVVTRNAAMVEVAMFDAINGIDPKYTYFYVAPAAKAGASRRAAAAQAAHTVLTKLFGSGATPVNGNLQGAFDSLLRITLQDVAADEGQAALNDGVDWGRMVANKVLEIRSTDGFAPIPPATSFPPFPDDLNIGKWRRTPNLPASMALSSSRTRPRGR